MKGEIFFRKIEIRKVTELPPEYRVNPRGGRGSHPGLPSLQEGESVLKLRLRVCVRGSGIQQMPLGLKGSPSLTQPERLRTQITTRAA